MSKIIFLTLLLVASALADQSAEISSPHQESPVQVSGVPQSPASVVVSQPAQPVVVSGQAVESVPVVHQPVQVSGAEPHYPHPEHHQHQQHHHQAGEAHHGEAHQHHHHVVGEPNVHHPEHQHAQQHPQSVQQAASYYSPAGLIQVVGSEQPVAANKPVVRNFEQYGQPESASIPANYKPFGSWGLYIGGNPADGYYTNYYKALGSSVDKQQSSAGVVEPVVHQQVKPSSGVVSQAAAFSPVLKQASSSPYIGADYYPFAYSQADLNAAHQQHHSYQPAGSPPQPYSSGALVPEYPYLSYADQYATKRLGGAYQQKEVQVPVQQQQQQQQVQQVQQQQQQQQKGYQQRLSYVSYPAGVHHQPAVGHQQQQQVVAYPVPVGSQIVGSQPGVDGAFNPYGVHAFTRYAVKPTVVNSDSSYYSYSSYPNYRQQQSSVSSSGVQYQPFSFYGYPLNQLHYSQGSIVPSFPSSSSSSSSSPSTSGVESPVHHVSGGPASSPSAGVVVEHQSVAPVEHHHHHISGPVEAAASENTDSVVAGEKLKKKKSQ